MVFINGRGVIVDAKVWVRAAFDSLITYVCFA